MKHSLSSGCCLCISLHILVCCSSASTNCFFRAPKKWMFEFRNVVGYFQSVKVLTLCLTVCYIIMLVALWAAGMWMRQTAHHLWKEFTQAHHFSPFYFIHSDVGRAVHAPAHITEKVVQLFRSKSEFTFLASIQQKSSTSGVIFSIHESEHR